MNRGVLIFLLFLLAACRKATEVPEPIESGTWKISDDVYQSNSATNILYSPSWAKDSIIHIAFSAISTNNSNYITLDFTKMPVAGKKYKIVYQPKSDDEVSINFDGYPQGRRGGSADYSNQYLAVSADGSRFRYIATDITARTYTFVVDWDIKVSMNVTD